LPLCQITSLELAVSAAELADTSTVFVGDVVAG